MHRIVNQITEKRGISSPSLRSRLTPAHCHSISMYIYSLVRAWKWGQAKYWNDRATITVSLPDSFTPECDAMFSKLQAWRPLQTSFNASSDYILPLKVRESFDVTFEEVFTHVSLPLPSQCLAVGKLKTWCRWRKNPQLSGWENWYYLCRG